MDRRDRSEVRIPRNVAFGDEIMPLKEYRDGTTNNAFRKVKEK